MEASDPGLEGLIRDIMIVASECEFDNDIHMLVDSLSYQDPTSCSLDDLMEINDRYGDIVYNLISLREMYNQPIHELIDGPAFPLLLDEDRDPDEIKAALVMVSHAQKAEDGNPTMSVSRGNGDYTVQGVSKLHSEPTAAPSQGCGPSYPVTLASSQQPSYPNSQLYTQGSTSGEQLLLSSLQEMSARQQAAMMDSRYLNPIGVTGAAWNHSWVMPTDANVHHKRKRAVSSNSSSSSNEVYHPHSMVKKKSRRLSEPLWHSQMEPATEGTADNRAVYYHFPRNLPPEGMPPHPACNSSQPQAILEGTPLQDLPGMSRDAAPGQRISQQLQDPPPSSTARPEGTSNSSNDEDKGSDVQWLHLKAARERRACRRQRRLGTPKEMREASQGEAGEERTQLSYLGEDSNMLGAALNKSWELFQTLANSCMCDRQETTGCVPSTLDVTVSAKSSKEGVVVESHSKNTQSVAHADLALLPQLCTATTSKRSISAPNLQPPSLHPPASHPFQESGAVPQSPMHSSSSGSVDRTNDDVHQSENCVGLKHGQPRKRSKHKDDENNEYHGLKLWQFLLHLLLEGKHPSILRWVSKGDGLFRVLDSEGLARMWGGRRGHTDMNYDKMSRALRYYYNKNLLDKAPKRLHYQFKYYSRWWEKIQASDPTFKIQVIPQPPETKLPRDEIIAMGIIDCEELQQGRAMEVTRHGSGDS